MISLQRAHERRHDRHRKHETWDTIFPTAANDTTLSGSLESLTETRLGPSGRLTRAPRPETEVLTYVMEGSLECSDGAGWTGMLRAGEFQIAIERRGIAHSVANASGVHPARFLEFRLGLRPPLDGEPALRPRAPSYQQRRFYHADRLHRPCLVASVDGRLDSLLLTQDVQVYSAVLEPGRHHARELAARRAWLHVVRGRVALGPAAVPLVEGDTASLGYDVAVSFRSETSAEVILVTLPERTLAAASSETDAPQSRRRRADDADGLLPAPTRVHVGAPSSQALGLPDRAEQSATSRLDARTV